MAFLQTFGPSLLGAIVLSVILLLTGRLAFLDRPGNGILDLASGIKVCHLKRPDIHSQSSQVRHQQLACNEEESIIGNQSDELNLTFINEKNAALNLNRFMVTMPDCAPYSIAVT